MLVGCMTPGARSPAYLPDYAPSGTPAPYLPTHGFGASSSESEATGQAMGLGEVIRRSVARDPRIKAALAEVEVAQAEYQAAAVLPNPGLSISQTLMPFPGKPFTPELQGGPPQLDIGVSYTLDTILFGKRSSALESAQQAIDVAAAEYAEVVRQRVKEAVLAFYDVLQAEAVAALCQEAHEQVKKLEKITEQRVTLGSVGSIEQDRVKLAVLSTHRELLRAETELIKARTALAARTGSQGSGAVRGSLECPDPRAPPPLEVLLAQAEESRPDLLAARRKIRKAQMDLSTERARGYPELTVSAGVTRQFQARAIGMPDVSAWGVALETTLPIFDRNQGGVARAEAVRRQSEAELAATILEAYAEIAQAHQEYSLAYTLMTSDDVETLRAASNARDKIQESYKLGGRTLIEVLDAQEAYRQTVRLIIEARANYWRALHLLNAAVGKRVLP
ncbi:MAG: TolC family protein [Myxococcales bacterium]|nr:TolC family protein [Myxococcales bacterium]